MGFVERLDPTHQVDLVWWSRFRFSSIYRLVRRSDPSMENMRSKTSSRGYSYVRWFLLNHLVCFFFFFQIKSMKKIKNTSSGFWESKQKTDRETPKRKKKEKKGIGSGICVCACLNGEVFDLYLEIRFGFLCVCVFLVLGFFFGSAYVCLSFCHVCVCVWGYVFVVICLCVCAFKYTMSTVRKVYNHVSLCDQKAVGVNPSFFSWWDDQKMKRKNIKGKTKLKRSVRMVFYEKDRGSIYLSILGKRIIGLECFLMDLLTY